MYATTATKKCYPEGKLHSLFVIQQGELNGHLQNKIKCTLDREGQEESQKRLETFCLSVGLGSPCCHIEGSDLVMLLTGSLPFSKQILQDLQKTF